MLHNHHPVQNVSYVKDSLKMTLCHNMLMLHVFTIESLGKVNIINWTLSSEVMEHICSGIHLANNKPLNSSTIVNKSFEEFSAMMTIATWALVEHRFSH